MNGSIVSLFVAAFMLTACVNHDSTDSRALTPPAAAPGSASKPTSAAAPAAEKPKGMLAEHAAMKEGGSTKPARVEDNGSRLFGAELAKGGTIIALADIVAKPADYAGKTVRTEGEITQVCKVMGCWMELQAEGTPEIRVPMAGHSYFLPNDVVKHKATVEGTVAVEPLDEETKKHLASEGAKATDTAVSISATTVVVHEVKPDAKPEDAKAAPKARVPSKP